MTDETTIERVANEIARRLTDRLAPLVHEEPALLRSRLASLDGWALCIMLRVTSPEGLPRERRARPRHLGVVGVDHSLNRLVTRAGAHDDAGDPDLDAVDLDSLDDEDLIGAAHYVPETLPGYMLG